MDKYIKEKEKYKQDPKLRLKKIARSMAQKTPLKKEWGICKSPERLERHHWRYDKPLLVSTLCNSCHKAHHIKNFGGSEFGR